MGNTSLLLSSLLFFIFSLYRLATLITVHVIWNNKITILPFKFIFGWCNLHMIHIIHPESLCNPLISKLPESLCHPLISKLPESLCHPLISKKPNDLLQPVSKPVFLLAIRGRKRYLTNIRAQQYTVVPFSTILYCGFRGVIFLSWQKITFICVIHFIGALRPRRF